MGRIQFEQVTFQYPGGERNAIETVTLTVSSGAFCLLCGKSGCGKTTLLQQLKPAITPHGTRTGQVTLDGTPVEALSFRDQSTRIGYVMQDPDSQMVTDQVWHELAFGLENLGLEQQTIRLRVAEMAQFFGLQALFPSGRTHPLRRAEAAGEPGPASWSCSRMCWCWTNQPPSWIPCLPGNSFRCSGASTWSLG